VLVVRVHQALLEAQRLSPELVTRKIWRERFADVNAFERHLLRNGTALIKFHVRIAKKEQKRRLLARLNDPSKVWKAFMADIAERKLWPKHMAAYQGAIRNTSTKWFARFVIVIVIVNVLPLVAPLDKVVVRPEQSCDHARDAARRQKSCACHAARSRNSASQTSEASS
jgi:Polyphosphate kinase 2 (PPK2)